MEVRMDVHSLIADWPEQSREAAKLVIDKHGDPDEATDAQLIWHNRAPWRRIVATKAFYRHDFPTTHYDSVQGIIDYRVPPEKLAELGRFDGSVIVDRTPGEVSARCHDEEANNLALNLMHDIVTGKKDVSQAREYYKTEFLDYRRKKPTPYMERLRFPVSGHGEAADSDQKIISDAELKAAEAEGKTRPRDPR
jgi:hypothetical protein